MKKITDATRNEVAGRLRMKGLTLKSWAIEQGFNVNTVQKVVRRYAGTGKEPKGGITREILEKLAERIHG